MNSGGWSIDEVFHLIDREHRGWFGVYDIERLLKTSKLGGKSLVNDVELVVSVFDRSGTRVVSLLDF